jgi:hypothetical protein
MVVIAAHEHDVWEQLIERHQVAVSAIIAYDEARFHSRDQLGFSKNIDLPGDIAGERIVEVSATAAEMAACLARFDSVLASNLHDGEVECLAVLLSGANDSLSFCTADKAALVAVALLGLNERCVSLESLLKSIGLQKSLPPQYTDAWLKMNIEKGTESRIYGRGLSS